ncbi:SCP-like extracellular protein [Phytophthora palmivora]|uniref:SCP-like extracellular protein n=1 Tax=Phytophthora palmivora TaxID=4796 RepID=A0A2P4XU51_9STRA|nr:SCP-like extracellular protein [Phytophthora palmivora]
MHSTLQAAAQRQADDMAANNFMSHNGSDGSKMAQRAAEAGFTGGAIAENVAAGQKNVDAVVNSWMKSPGHRRNILGNYTVFGAAYAYNRNSKYKHSWAQVFGRGGNDDIDDDNDIPWRSTGHDFSSDPTDEDSTSDRNSMGKKQHDDEEMTVKVQLRDRVEKNVAKINELEQEKLESQERLMALEDVKRDLEATVESLNEKLATVQSEKEEMVKAAEMLKAQNHSASIQEKQQQVAQQEEVAELQYQLVKMEEQAKVVAEQLKTPKPIEERISKGGVGNVEQGHSENKDDDGSTQHCEEAEDPEDKVEQEQDQSNEKQSSDVAEVME